MKKKFFTNYCITMNNVSNQINFSNNININHIKIDKTKKNLFILNHSSIFDNFILANICVQNNISWNDLRTVSSKSEKKSLQNRVLDIHQMFLVSGNLQEDSKTFENLWEKWKESEDNIQIILFPEGTIYNNTTLNKEYTKSQKYIMNKIINTSKFKNLLFPNIGAFNLIIDKLSKELEYVYDFSITYKDINKNRVFNEENIVNNLAQNNLFINVEIKKYSIKDVIKDPYWLFKLWEKKDRWYEEN